ncbi:hypothetical protein ACLOJK_003990 [Asimina triloba]
MAALKDLLRPAKSRSASFYDHSKDLWFRERFNSSASESVTVVKAKPVPPYGKRQGFVPRKPEDFGDGGAFLEIHVAQKIMSEEEKVSEELEKEIQKTNESTKAALEKIVNVRLSAAQPKNVPSQSSDSKFIKYKPSQESAAFNSGAKERIIRIVEMPMDPLEPPKFKHKRVPKADPFGLDLLLSELKKGSKKAMEKIGSGGAMKASAGSSMRDGYEGAGSGRTRIGFERGH